MMVSRMCTRSLYGVVMIALSACGGSDTDSGGGTGTTNPTNSNTPSSSSGSATPSANHPASGFYAGPQRVAVAGPGKDFSVSMRIVIDPGGGAAVFENGQLLAQARVRGRQFVATRMSNQDRLFGLTCIGERRYTVTVSGSNMRLSGTYVGRFSCDTGVTFVLTSTFSLPRVGDHQ